MDPGAGSQNIHKFIMVGITCHCRCAVVLQCSDCKGGWGTGRGGDGIIPAVISGGCRCDDTVVQQFQYVWFPLVIFADICIAAAADAHVDRCEPDRLSVYIDLVVILSQQFDDVLKTADLIAGVGPAGVAGHDVPVFILAGLREFSEYIDRNDAAFRSNAILAGSNRRHVCAMGEI